MVVNDGVVEIMQLEEEEKTCHAELANPDSYNDSEKAKEYGLDDIGNSVQATFFDYDRDGDLDVYIANYPPTRFDTPNQIYQYQILIVLRLWVLVPDCILGTAPVLKLVPVLAL